MVLHDPVHFLKGIGQGRLDIGQARMLILLLDGFVQFGGSAPGVSGSGHFRFFAGHTYPVPFKEHQVPMMQVGQYIPNIAVERSAGEIFVL